MDPQNSCNRSSVDNNFNHESSPLSTQYHQPPDFHLFPHISLTPNQPIFNQQYPFSTQHPFSHLPYRTSFSQPNPIPPSKSTQKERNPNWSKDEDEALCKAWLRISKDAAIGTDQSRNKLWDRIVVEFNYISGKSSNRLSSALMHRWSAIQAQLNKYSDCLRSVEISPASGDNFEDSIGAAKEFYYRAQKQHFKLDGYWLILKDTPKWFHYTKEQVEKKEKTKVNKKRSLDVGIDIEGEVVNLPSHIVTPSLATSSIDLEDDDSQVEKKSYVPRPVGRKAAKMVSQKRIEKQFAAANLIVAELTHIRKDQKEISEREIQAKQEQERLKLEAKLMQEKMKIAAKKEQLLAKHEQERFKLENDIMMTDPNSVTTEEGKVWLIAQQKTILARMAQPSTRDSINKI